MKPTLRFHGASGVRFATGFLLLWLVLLAPAFAQPTKDFGDAPSPYPTLLNQGGARHTVTGPLLGSLRDAEFDGLPQAAAFGDDNDNNDDEDGVVFLNPLVPGQTNIIRVTISGVTQPPARLSAWIDFDINGSWNEAANRILPNVPVANGTTNFSILVPAGAKIGPTFARFRINTQGDLNPGGDTTNGEVEDYRVSISEAMDFGDAPTNNYPTLFSQNGARHRVDSSFFLGTRIDSDPDGQPNVAATGDDINPAGADDEDGVTFVNVLLTAPNSIVRVVCTMNVGTVGRLNAWVDFNRDGDWGESNEQIFADVTVVPGTNTLSFPVPAGASGGITYARFRLSRDGKIGPGGFANDGEVEDYVTAITAALDFGDAPTNSYPVLLAQNGARHVFTNDFCLGTSVDGETNGQPDADAKGDDSASTDDEDGVTATSSIVPGQFASLQVFVTGAGAAGGPVGVLNAWLDFNRDGDWSDAGEQIFTNRSVVAGVNSLSFSVPATASEGATFARFRLNRQGGLAPTGLASDGEVEDYRLNISPDLDFGDAPAPYPTTLKDNGARHNINRSIHLGPREDSEPDGQPEIAANGDDVNPPQLDDEDGVFFVGPIIEGESATVQVVASVQGTLYAWIDFNINGSWADAGERVFNGVGVVPGTNTLVFSVPAGAKSGRTVSRFRYTTLSVPVDFVGLVGNGEVEDHVLSIMTDRDRCDHNCEGKQYWLTFPGNYAPDPDNPARLTLCLMGPAGTAANVAVPGIGFTTNVVIPAAQALYVPVPRAAELADLNDVVTNLGIRVIASAPISITAYNHAKYTTDSYMALNTSVVGTRYIVQGFGNTQSGVPPLNGTQFAIVATESNTIVGIRPTASAGSRTAGVPYLLSLKNPGDAYQLRSTNDAPADLSGTLIVSDKPIAVFGSHLCANVPSSNVWFCNYLVEQTLPVNTWGNDFYTAPLATRSNDTFRVFAAQNNTTVLVNGVPLTPLNIGEFHQFNLNIRSRIVADKPVLLTQYANSGDFDGNTNSDPFMLTVQATRHYATAYRINTPTNDFPTNYVHLVVPTAATGTIQIDGVPVGAVFAPIAGTAYSAARVLVTPGRHFVTGGTPFGCAVYGWAEYDSYGHPACMYFGDVAPPRLTPSFTTATANVNDYPNSPGFVPSPNFASATTTQDNCDNEPRTADRGPKPGTFVPPGVHTIRLSVVDFNGNTGETNVTFTVLDPSPVTIKCPSDITVNCRSNNGAIVDFVVEAYSTFDTNVPVVSTPPSGSFFPSGTTIVTNIATSLAGQTNICTFKVTVLCDTRVNITGFNNNNLTLTWAGLATLQFSTNPAGTWSNVVSGVNQYVAPLTGRQGFFRVLY